MLESDAYVKIKKMILDGDLAAGTVLSEANLCKDLGMSRTPVRVAINRLDIEGFVTQSKGHFSTVRLITPEDICNFFQLSLITEEYVARTLHEKPELLDAARAAACIEQQSLAVQAGDSFAATTSDHAFHMTFCDALGNRELSFSMENIWTKTLLALNPKIRRSTSTVGLESIEEHRRILNCVTHQASLDELLDAVRTHNSNARNRMLLR